MNRMLLDAFAALRASAGRQAARVLLTLSLVGRALTGAVASLRRAGGHSGSGQAQAGPVTMTHRLTPAHLPDSLHPHEPRPHVVQNANHMRQRAQAQASLNTRIAVALTKRVGTMQTAYMFAGIGIGSLVGVFTGNAFLAALFGSVSSYFLQLVLLPILSVGQNVLSAHQEAQADQQFAATMNTLHDAEEMARHLDAQDAELLKQTQMLQQMLGALMSSQNVPIPATTPPAPTAPAQRRPRRTLAAATQPQSQETSA